MIEPVDLSDAIQRYCPIEYVCSLLIGFFGIFCDEAPLIVRLSALPLMLYNARRYSAKDHKLYFITKVEYKTHFTRMEMQYQCKTCYYTVLFVMSLVMSILAAITFFDLAT